MAGCLEVLCSEGWNGRLEDRKTHVSSWRVGSRNKTAARGKRIRGAAVGKGLGFMTPFPGGRGLIR